MTVTLWDVIDTRTDAPLAMDVADHSEACRICEIFLRNGVPARVAAEVRRETAEPAGGSSG